jgi:hypothetical protein
MILEIPTTPGDPAYTQRTTLDGREYFFEFRWNDRDGAWYMHLADDQEQHIRSGIRIVCNWPLLRRITDPRKPPGSIMAIDTEGSDQTPGLHDLGARVKLFYLDAAELAAIRKAS